MVQIYGLACAIEITTSFGDLILIDGSALNGIVGTFSNQHMDDFLQAYVISSFRFVAICFIDSLTRISINVFFEY
jgi:hypothetical protein